MSKVESNETARQNETKAAAQTPSQAPTEVNDTQPAAKTEAESSMQAPPNKYFTNTTVEPSPPPQLVTEAAKPASNETAKSLADETGTTETKDKVVSMDAYAYDENGKSLEQKSDKDDDESQDGNIDANIQKIQANIERINRLQQKLKGGEAPAAKASIQIEEESPAPKFDL